VLDGCEEGFIRPVEYTEKRGIDAKFGR